MIHFKRKFLGFIVAIMVGGLPLQASTAYADHNLTDEQLHAFMGIITNFILMSDSVVALTLVTNPASTTEASSVTVDVQSTVGNKVYVDGIEVGVIGANGTLSIVLALNHGDNEIYITVKDAAGNESQPLILNIYSNALPVGIADSVTTNEDTLVTIDVLDNDTDVDDTTLNITNLTNPTNGTVNIVSNKIEYTPNANWSGTDTFTYTPNDSTVDGNVVTVTVTVSAVNDAPVANAQSVTLDEDTIDNEIILTGSDVDSNSLTYTIETQPTHGTVSLAGTVAKYTPTANYFGADSFTFSVNDGTVNSSDATVSITVNDVAEPDTVVPVITLIGQSEITITSGQAYNDAGATASDNIDGDITASIVTANPVNTNILGTYIITYNVNDSAGNSAVQVTRTVHVEASLPLLIIRIEFLDYAFENVASVWHDKIYGTSAGQLNHYVNEISYGKFQFVAVNETEGTINDGIITVQLNENHPNTGVDATAFLSRLNSAISLANAHIDFSTYDTNNDNAISKNELQIMYLVAGGESATGTSPGIWAHAWCMYGVNASAPTHDGVKLMNCGDNGGYSRFGEKHGTNDASIGIIAHELGHAAFELPDLYDTDGGSEGIGNFGLMGSGSWAYKLGDTQSGQTPVHMTGWSKMQSGFLAPTMVDTGVTSLTLHATSSSDYELYKLPTGVVGEYFLIENRAASGYDMGLTSLEGTSNFTGGLSILHIDDNVAGNTDENHKLVDVEEANNAGLDSEVDRGHINNLYFNGNATSFNSSTTPNSNRYDGVGSGVSVENISDADAVMTADININ